jgi:endonuclease/exonuclease/phosphatase family metal-dependent hydrolase
VPAAPAPRLRLATFNIRHGAPNKGYRGDPERLAAACASLAADVLALQEVDRGLNRSGRADLARVVAEAAGMRHLFAPTMDLRGGEYGNALLVRGDIDDVEIVRLPGGYRFWVRREPRNAIVATVRPERAGGRALSVAATHLSTQRWASRGQLSEVVRVLTARAHPQVLLGDLNRTCAEIKDHPAVKRIGFVDGGEPTFPAVKPVLRIDHVAVNGLEVEAVAAVRLPVSDHLALVADVSGAIRPDRRPGR